MMDYFSAFQIHDFKIGNDPAQVNRDSSCLNGYHWPWSSDALLLQNNPLLLFWRVITECGLYPGRSLTGFSNTFVRFLSNWVCAKINSFHSVRNIAGSLAMGAERPGLTLVSWLSWVPHLTSLKLNKDCGKIFLMPCSYDNS